MQSLNFAYPRLQNYMIQYTPLFFVNYLVSGIVLQLQKNELKQWKTFVPMKKLELLHIIQMGFRVY